MRHRPKRENYPTGLYGDIDYQKRLEGYCTYLENKNKALTEQCNIADVVGQSEQLFCPYCGDKKQLKVETDLNSGRVCKNRLCKAK